MNNAHQNIVFFDGHCNLCNGAVDFLIRHDKRQSLYFCSLQSDFAQKFLKENNYNSGKIDTIVFYQNGHFLERSDAIIAILKTIGYKYIAKFLNLFPSNFSVIVYNLVAKNRYKLFGKRETCRLPSENEKERFLV